MKKILAVFLRDIKSNSRDFIAMYIILVPIIFGIIINLLVPSVNETTLNLAFVEGENPSQVEYLENFAKITLVSDYEAMEERVSRRDQVIGIYNEGGAYQILVQGNEMTESQDFAKLLLYFEQNDVDFNNANAKIHSFEKDLNPMKTLFVNLILMMLGVLGGMLIGINIVEEKVDNTISAVNVTPISRLGFIVGKSLVGIILPIYGSITIVYLTGFREINFLQLVVLTLLGSIVGILVGFFEGTKNTDIMEVAASIKGLFLPVLGVVAAVEFLSDKWQWLFMWLPWYWVYKGNQMLLNYEATWAEIGLYALYIIIPSILVFLYLKKGIRKGLE